MPYNGVATPVALTPITVAFFVTNVKENIENHESRLTAVELPIAPARLSSANAPTDTHTPTFDAATGQFRWAVGFPVGVGAWVRKAAEIPAGFAREIELDGRIPVGAGTTFSVTYTEGISYGSSWSHLHNVGGHFHGDNFSIGNPTDTEAASGSGGSVAADGHRHNISGQIVGPTGDTNTAPATWVIPSRAVVWIRKS